MDDTDQHHEPATAGDRGHHRQVVVGGWLTVVAGLFLMAAPFLFGYRVVGQAVANDLLAGAALAVAGAVGLRRAPRVPIAAVQALIGVWLLVAPTVLGYGGGPFVQVGLRGPATYTTRWGATPGTVHTALQMQQRHHDGSPDEGMIGLPSGGGRHPLLELGETGKLDQVTSVDGTGRR